MPLKKWFLDIAACPHCGFGPIEIVQVFEEKDGNCVRGKTACKSCGTTYEIVDGVPVLHDESPEREHGENRH